MHFIVTTSKLLLVLSSSVSEILVYVNNTESAGDRSVNEYSVNNQTQNCEVIDRINNVYLKEYVKRGG